jgi:hypothetical protein
VVAEQVVDAVPVEPVVPVAARDAVVVAVEDP